MALQLAALGCLQNQCNFFLVIIDPILFKQTDNKEMHNILDKFEFQTDLTTE